MGVYINMPQLGGMFVCVCLYVRVSMWASTCVDPLVCVYLCVCLSAKHLSQPPANHLGHNLSQ